MFETAIHEESSAAINRLQEKHPDLKSKLSKAYAYAVFPSVGRAAVVLGGAYGQGEVYEQGNPVGFATLSQMTIGVQVGGQTFSEILFFENKQSLDRFKKRGKVGFTANASAAIVKAGATATNSISGIDTVAYSQGGLLLELSMGGSKCLFIPPLSNSPHSTNENKVENQAVNKNSTGDNNNKQDPPQQKSVQNSDKAQNDNDDPPKPNWISEHLKGVPVVSKLLFHNGKGGKSALGSISKKAGELISGVKTELETNKVLHKDVEAALYRLQDVYPEFWKSIDKAYGFAVFPSIGRAGLVLGGAYGKGEVFEKKKLVGYAGIVQLTIGVQVGGETLTAIVMFNDKDGLERFKQGKIGFTANAAAVIVKAGAEATNNYQSDRVYFFSDGGLLIDAAIGGQKFIYRQAALTRNQTVQAA